MWGPGIFALSLVTLPNKGPALDPDVLFYVPLMTFPNEATTLDPDGSTEKVVSEMSTITPDFQLCM